MGLARTGKSLSRYDSWRLLTKVIVCVTMAFLLQFTSSRTMCKRIVSVANVIKEVNFRLVEENGSSYRMNRRITPSFVEETTCSIKVLKVSKIGGSAQPIQISYLKVGPKVAHVVGISPIIGHKINQIVFWDEIGIFLHEIFDGWPERTNGRFIFKKWDGPTCEYKL